MSSCGIISDQIGATLSRYYLYLDIICKCKFYVYIIYNI